MEVDQLRNENQLLEQYLRQKNVELPSDYTSIPASCLTTCRIVTSDFKLQIAIEALSQLNNVLETRKEAANKYISTLKIMLRESELRIQDVQREAHDFQTKVVDGGKCANNPQRFKAEQFVRYMEQKLYDQESALDKLRLKINTSANRKRKLEAQLDREEEASFHYIDYHQMQIRLKQSKKLLEETASKVALRKISREKSKAGIVALQEQLSELKSKCITNKKAVTMRETYLERLNELVYSKEDEVDVLKNTMQNRQSPDNIMEDEPTGPDVMEYIMQKALIYELREKIKAMERKVEIAKGCAKQKEKGNDIMGVVPFKDHRSTRWAPRML